MILCHFCTLHNAVLLHQSTKCNPYAFALDSPLWSKNRVFWLKPPFRKMLTPVFISSPTFAIIIHPSTPSKKKSDFFPHLILCFYSRIFAHPWCLRPCVTSLPAKSQLSLSSRFLAIHPEKKMYNLNFSRTTRCRPLLAICPDSRRRCTRRAARHPLCDRPLLHKRIPHILHFARGFYRTDIVLLLSAKELISQILQWPRVFLSF